MKFFNLKAIIGMGFLAFLFVPAWGNRELVCQEIIAFVQRAEGNPRELCRRAGDCFPEAREELCRAADASNALAFFSLLKGALQKLPPHMKVRLEGEIKNVGWGQIRKLKAIVESTQR